MKKVLFIDRDGTLVVEPPVDYQLDSFEKLEFVPKVFRNLGFIRSKLDFEFAMVTNQDGLGTSSFPEETFWPVHNLVMQTLANEGITFDEIFKDNKNRKTHISSTKFSNKVIDANHINKDIKDNLLVKSLTKTPSSTLKYLLNNLSLKTTLSISIYS